MTTPVKFYSFSTDLTNAKHDFSSHEFKVMLTLGDGGVAGVPPALTCTAKANITEIAALGGYVAGGVIVTISKNNASGVEKLIATDATWTAVGVAIPTFRYLVLYNNSQTTPAKPVVCYWDYGSNVSLAVSQIFTLDMDATNGFATVG